MDQMEETSSSDLSDGSECFRSISDAEAAMDRPSCRESTDISEGSDCYGGDTDDTCGSDSQSDVSIGTLERSSNSGCDSDPDPDLEHEYDPDKGSLTILQCGAGSGKTYRIIRYIDKTDSCFSHVKTFIYLTKAHSAKDVCQQELKSQVDDLRLPGVEILSTDTNSNKYVNKCKVKGNDNILVIVATIDSFIHCFTKDTPELNSNMMLTRAIEMGRGNYHFTQEDNTFKFAQQRIPCDNTTVIIVDESQDLPIVYFDALATLIRNHGINVHAVGDKLQSIYEPNNIFVKWKQYQGLPDEQDPQDQHQRNSQGRQSQQNSPILVNCTTRPNEVRRFHNKYLMESVNKLIPFEAYGLKSITGCNPEATATNTDKNNAIIVYDRADEPEFSSRAEYILREMRRQARENAYLPNDFMVLFPIMKNNSWARYLEITIHEMWCKLFDDVSYRNILTRADKDWSPYRAHMKQRKMSYIHTSDLGRPIRLRDSEGATMLISIHGAKGVGRNVVFVTGLSYASLMTLCTHNENDGELFYVSMLNVAVTRQKKTLYIEDPGDRDIPDPIKNKPYNIHNWLQRLREPLGSPIVKQRIGNPMEHESARDFTAVDKTIQYGKGNLDAENITEMIMKDGFRKTRMQTIIDNLQSRFLDLYDQQNNQVSACWSDHLIRAHILDLLLAFRLIDVDLRNYRYHQLIKEKYVDNYPPNSLHRQQIEVILQAFNKYVANLPASVGGLFHLCEIVNAEEYDGYLRNCYFDGRSRSAKAAENRNEEENFWGTDCPSADKGDTRWIVIGGTLPPRMENPPWKRKYAPSKTNIIKLPLLHGYVIEAKICKWGLKKVVTKIENIVNSYDIDLDPTIIDYVGDQNLQNTYPCHRHIHGGFDFVADIAANLDKTTIDAEIIAKFREAEHQTKTTFSGRWNFCYIQYILLIYGMWAVDDTVSYQITPKKLYEIMENYIMLLLLNKAECLKPTSENNKPCKFCFALKRKIERELNRMREEPHSRDDVNKFNVDRINANTTEEYTRNAKEMQIHYRRTNDLNARLHDMLCIKNAWCREIDNEYHLAMSHPKDIVRVDDDTVKGRADKGEGGVHAMKLRTHQRQVVCTNESTSGILKYFRFSQVVCFPQLSRISGDDPLIKQLVNMVLNCMISFDLSQRSLSETLSDENIQMRYRLDILTLTAEHRWIEFDKQTIIDISEIIFDCVEFYCRLVAKGCIEGTVHQYIGNDNHEDFKYVTDVRKKRVEAIRAKYLHKILTGHDKYRQIYLMQCNGDIGKTLEHIKGEEDGNDINNAIVLKAESMITREEWEDEINKKVYACMLTCANNITGRQKTLDEFMKCK